MRSGDCVRAGVVGLAVGVGVGLGAAMTGVGAGPWAPQARAQTFSMSTRGATSDEGGPPVTRAHLTRYAKVLGLSADQLEAAELLVDGAIERHTLARVEMTEKMGDLRAEAAESGDWRIMMEEVPPVQEAYAAARKEIDEEFFDNLRLLLTPEQEAKWDGVERTKRRLTTIGQGSLAGECVDLVELCDTLDPPADVREQLEPVLDRYELDLDRALVERNTLQQEQVGMSGIGSGSFDLDKMSKLTAQIREASQKVQGVNENYARQIGGILTGDDAEQFATLWMKGAFPKVYAKTYTSEVLDAAEGFEDLTGDQRDRLDRLQARYERELAALNDKWAKAIQETEGQGQGGVMMAAGGQMMVVEMGDQDGGPVDDARTARRDLNRDYLSQVRGLLSPEQRSRLPERQVATPGPGGGGQATEMQFIAIESDDEGAPPPTNDAGGNRDTK